MGQYMVRYYNGITSSSSADNNYYNRCFDQTYATTSYESDNYLHDNSSTCTTQQIPYGQYLYIHTGYTYLFEEGQRTAHKPTEQELRIQREERIKAEEAAKRAKEEAEEAAKKARLLLVEYLDQENIKRLTNKEPLEIHSKLFENVKYKIPISNGRIVALKNNDIITELCLAVKESGHLPMDDIILTKFLYILHDEENVIRTANHYVVKENLLTMLN